VKHLGQQFEFFRSRPVAQVFEDTSERRVLAIRQVFSVPSNLYNARHK
jgi:hypothetical protein